MFRPSYCLENIYKRMNNNQVEYRRADLEDIEALVNWRAKFLKDIFKNENEEENSRLKKELRKYFEKALPEDNYVAWFAQVCNEIVGIGAMAIYDTPPKYFAMNGKIGIS